MVCELVRPRGVGWLGRLLVPGFGLVGCVLAVWRFWVDLLGWLVLCGCYNIDFMCFWLPGWFWVLVYCVLWVVGWLWYCLIVASF